MKQCPVCEKTFDDAMRFCQADGTPLVEKAEPVDPYKTMVASKADIAAAMPPVEPALPAVPAPKEEEVLEIPAAADPNKTQFVSEEELRAEMAAGDEQVIEVPPVVEPPAPPAFSEPSLSPPSFGDPGGTPPPSPFSTPNEAPPVEAAPQESPFSKTTPPIPSPFDAPKPAAPKPAPATPQFTEPPAMQTPPPQVAEPTAANEPSFNPFEQPAPQSNAPIAQAEWTPPPIPESNMQNQQNFGQNPQFSQPPAAGGPSSTLSIVSLVLGILGLTICCGTFVPSLLAVILGFMGRNKANQDPAQYGGAGLALGGLITGAIGLIGGVIFWIVYVLYFAAIMASMR